MILMDKMTVRWVIIWFFMTVLFLGAEKAARWAVRKIRQRRNGRLSREEQAAFAAIVARWDDADLDEILGDEGDEW